MEPAALSATVEQYNKVCAEGYDSDFAKDPHFLNAVAKAPFYAHVTTPSLGFALVTTGGFVTTNDQQVLNEDYQPIEGLYASGNTCGMRFGPEYITPIDIPPFQQLGGENAAAELLDLPPFCAR